MRDAVAGVLGTADLDGLPSPDLAWRDRWPALAELGVTGLCVPEDRGGAGFQVEVAAGIAAELGAGLSGAPFASTVAAAHVLAREESDLLAGILSGERLAGYARLDPATDAAARVDGAADVDVLVLEDPDTGELLLFDDPSSWSVTGPAPQGFDVSRTCADLDVDATRARRLSSDPTARHLFSLLVAADVVGVVERSFDTTVRYAAQREAFGRPIGGFQAVQHTLSDHVLRLRSMALLVRDAARALGADAPDAQRRVTLAAASTSAGATPLLHELLQLTGGIGFTWEYGLHAFERRAHQDAVLLGGPRAARDALARLEGWTA